VIAAAMPRRSSDHLPARPRGLRRLLIQRLAVLHAASQELRPCRYNRDRIGALRKQSPKRRMVPTEFVKTAVAMLTNAVPQLLYLTQEFFARHPAQIFIHQTSPVCYDAGPAGYAVGRRRVG
jgi:hypothetical protein